LDASEIAGLEYKEFVQMVSSNRWRYSQEKRLQSIWKMAVDSVGCEAGPAVEFEAQVMVEDILSEMAKIKTANSSVRASTPKVVVVRGPFALPSRTIATMAAGAELQAIAPRMNAIGKKVFLNVPLGISKKIGLAKAIRMMLKSKGNKV